MTRTKAPSGYKLTQEEVQLPGTRKDRAELLTTILETGGVQKLTAEVGKPIRVLRWVKSTDSPDVDILGSDLALAVRNTDMEELEFQDGTEPLLYLRRAFTYLSEKGLRPVVRLIQAWLLMQCSAHSWGLAVCLTALTKKSPPAGG